MDNAIQIAQLEPHLKQLHQSLSQFQQLLDTETDCLKKADLTQLSKISTDKATLSEQIEVAHSRLISNITESLAVDAKVNFSLAEIIALPIFEQLPSNIQEQLTEAVHLIEDCHNKNLTNGMTIQALSNINQNAIRIIAGASETQTTYGSEGKKASAGSAKKTLGTA